jgi:Family of unknown function (DUF6262)
MDLAPVASRTRAEQCKRNAQEKSEKKRRAAFEALNILLREERPVTKAAVAKRAGVSVVFLRSHLDLSQAIEEAEKSRITYSPMPTPGERAKDQVIAALHRRLEKMKEDLAKKDATIRQKDREIEILYGKLALGKHDR